MSSEVNITHYKTLDELSFEDLCIEESEQTYPALRAGLRDLWKRVRRNGANRSADDYVRVHKKQGRRRTAPHT